MVSVTEIIGEKKTLMLVSLLYFSRLSERCTLHEIDNILVAAHIYNPAKEITGFLCHSDTYFFQVLEGARAEVNHLYNKIIADPRHEAPQIMAFNEISDRTFADWHMGSVRYDKEAKKIFLKQTGTDRISPDKMDGPTTYRILTELSHMQLV